MARANEQPLPGRHRKNMKTAPSRRQVGLLEVLAYLAAIVVAVGSVVRGWDFNLLIASIMLVVAYAVLRDVRGLSRSETQNEQAQSSETKLSLQKVLRGGRAQPQSQQISFQHGETRKFQEFVRWVRSLQHTSQKGTTHESNGVSKA
ncbi:MAG: hypothetical protein HY038_08600 [Nitrospirae bacterium]|nr:hypothetical protein [Nitrospirota bacterium]